MTFNSFKEVAQLFDFDLYDMLDEIFKRSQVQKTMIEFNQDQLQTGMDALGQTINTIGGNPYRVFTIRIKRKEGKPMAPADKVTLYDTGDFYKTFAVRILNNGYEIIANFIKSDGDIRDNLPSEFDVLGLDDESATELVMEYVYPLLYQMIRKKLGI